MKGLAHGGLSPNSSPMKMNGVAAWRTGSECPSAWLLGEGWAGPCLEILVTWESQESSPCFPEMARRRGSLWLPVERAARRANDWHTGSSIP